MKMMTCPRCGFSQPQDDYCAQCGLDIKNYQLPPEKKVKTFFASPFFHFVIIALLIAITIPVSLRLYSQFKSTGEKSLTSLQMQKSKESVFIKSQSPSLEDSKLNPPSVEVMVSEPTAVVESRPSEVINNNIQPVAKIKDKKNADKKIEAYYLEVDQSEWLAYQEEAANEGQYFQSPEHTVGVIKNWPQKSKSKRVRVLQKQDFAIQENNTWAWQKKILQESTNSPLLALQFMLEVQNSGKETLKVQFEMEKIIKNEKSNFPAYFEIQKNQQVFFISGLLPRSLKSEKTSETDDFFMQALKSHRWASGQSELVMVLVFFND